MVSEEKANAILFFISVTVVKFQNKILQIYSIILSNGIVLANDANVVVK